MDLVAATQVTRSRGISSILIIRGIWTVLRPVVNRTTHSAGRYSTIPSLRVLPTTQLISTVLRPMVNRATHSATHDLTILPPRVFLTVWKTIKVHTRATLIPASPPMRPRSQTTTPFSTTCTPRTRGIENPTA